MPEEFQDYRALLTRLSALIRERSARIIGIEGYGGAGKSCLAKMLGQDLSLVVIGTDEYLPPGGAKNQRYIDSIDLVMLLAKLEDELAAHGVVIVEGIGLRDTLDRIEHKADLTIYVDWCLPQKIRQQWVSDLAARRRGRKFKYAPTNYLLDYCIKVRPYETADLALIVLEESP